MNRLTVKPVAVIKHSTAGGSMNDGCCAGCHPHILPGCEIGFLTCDGRDESGVLLCASPRLGRRPCGDDEPEEPKAVYMLVKFHK